MSTLRVARFPMTVTSEDIQKSFKDNGFCVEQIILTEHRDHDQDEDFKLAQIYIKINTNSSVWELDDDYGTNYSVSKNLC